MTREERERRRVEVVFYTNDKVPTHWSRAHQGGGTIQRRQGVNSHLPPLALMIGRGEKELEHTPWDVVDSNEDGYAT